MFLLYQCPSNLGSHQFPKAIEYRCMFANYTGRHIVLLCDEMVNSSTVCICYIKSPFFQQIKAIFSLRFKFLYYYVLDCIPILGIFSAILSNVISIV